MTKYVVFVNEFNPNSDESIEFEESFNSLKEVTNYTKTFYDRKYCCGRVEKWSKENGDDSFISDIIMRF